MPYVIGPNAVVAITLRGKHEFQDVMSIFHYRYNGSQQITDGAAALNSIWTHFNGAGGMFGIWVSCLSSKVTQLEARLQWITPSRFAYVSKTDPAKVQGAVGGDAMPVNTAVSITKRTQNAGRSEVGTLHMPGVPQLWIVNGILQQAGVDQYAGLAAKMLEAISTVAPAMELLPVLFHKSSPDVSPQFVNTSLQGFARVMRRRTVGLGS